KKLGRIPDGGGHRILGRSTETRRLKTAVGYDHFEVVVDDATRLAYVAHVPDESARSASQALLDAAVWFAGHGVRIERVLTDNAWAYRHTYDRAVSSIGARHKRTRPHRPQTNGKDVHLCQAASRARSALKRVPARSIVQSTRSWVRARAMTA
ncbi:MAG: DDE-type integrase/transposase/recombinase, partial [Chloroflexi bacterium]|nr:DDE-type integrase/transposase/recombinase [Chloroflexota bacterium]